MSFRTIEAIAYAQTFLNLLAPSLLDNAVIQEGYYMHLMSEFQLQDAKVLKSCKHCVSIHTVSQYLYNY